MDFFKDDAHLAKIRKARLLQEKMYQLEPSAWLQTRFREGPENLKWSEHPEYKNHKWDGTPDPFYEAINALANLENVGIESATAVGKTWVLARVCYWFLDAFPGSLVITTAPTKQQLEEVLWKEISRAWPKFHRIRPFAEKVTLKVRVDGRQVEHGEDEDKNVTHKMLGFVSSRRAGSESDIKFQGHHQKWQLFVLDETAGLDESILTAIENTNVTAGNLAIGVGNPDSQLDALHLFCEKHNTRHIIISALDHPNIVCGTEKISGAVTQQSIDERKIEYGEESPFYKSRVRGIAPAQDKDSMIKNAWIDQCGVWDGKRKEEDRIDDHTWPALGVDAAHSEAGDKAALVWGESNTVQFIEEFQCPSTTHLAYNVLMSDDDLIKKYGPEANYHTRKIKDFNIADKNIGVDSVGVGAGTVDAFNDKRMKVISLAGGQLESALKVDSLGNPYYQFNNIVSQMHWELAKDLENGAIILNITNKKLIRQVKKELLVIKYKVQSGKIRVESKDERKKVLGGKSPNIADALVYWNWVRKSYYRGPMHLPFR